jgi:hypothetical protein
MTLTAQSAAFATQAPLTRTPGVLARLRRHFARTKVALSGQARRTALNRETPRDTGLTPDDLTGAPSYDPALPFFFQAGFGCRNL